MKFGAHISSKAPFGETIARAKELGCETMQIFVNAPQRWSPVAIPTSEINKFVEANEKAKIDPIIIHSIYLINLASSNSFFYESSIKSLIDDMKKGKLIGAKGVNLHVGSTKGKDFSEVVDKVTIALKSMLAAVPDGPDLILENSAGAGNIIGDKFSELGQIIKAAKSDRIKICLDTTHAYASGYNVATKEGLDETIEEFDREIGLDRLTCLHLNDSLVPWGSNKDRHADIGEGYIGLKGFKNIVNHPKLKNIPGIIETPSLKGKSDVDNIKILRNLCE